MPAKYPPPRDVEEYSARALLAWRLRRLRELRRISQPAAAAILGLAQSGLSELESGVRQPSLAQLWTFSKLYAALVPRRPLYWYLMPPMAEEEGGVKHERQLSEAAHAFYTGAESREQEPPPVASVLLEFERGSALRSEARMRALGPEVLNGVDASLPGW